MHRSLILILALAGPAGAQPTRSNAEAEALFEQGRKLLEDGKLAEACAAFDASYKGAPAVSTIFNQANCRERAGQLATAYGHYREADRQTRAPLDDRTQELNRVARTKAQALVDRLSKLAIEVPPDRRIPGLEVLRGSELVDAGAWGHLLPVDGGSYTITVRAPDHEPWTTAIEVAAERDVQTVTVPKLAAKPRPIVKVPPPARSRVPLYLGGGALALGVGAFAFELSGRSAYARSEREVDNTEQRSLFDSAKRQRYVAQALGLAGAAAAGVAVWWYVRDRRRARAVEVTPVVSTQTVGLALDGRW